MLIDLWIRGPTSEKHIYLNDDLTFASWLGHAGFPSGGMFHFTEITVCEIDTPWRSLPESLLGLNSAQRYSYSYYLYILSQLEYFSVF